MLNLKLIINAEDRASPVMRRVNAAVDGIASRARSIGSVFQRWANNSGFENVAKRAEGVSKALDKVGSRAREALFRITALAGAGIYAFKAMFVDTAAKFERFQTILETLEGSSQGAKRAMDWVNDFATKTPYELDEVMDAFVRLRSYGMEPTKGLLKTLGDTSAAMGKPLSQAVEAIADAVTGENERLTEFGIKAQLVGKRIVYEYTSNGKTMTAVADKNSREQIQAVLSAIFNEKYAGAMEKLSGTWDGLLSNLSDQWTRFTKMVMERGPFQALKARVADILDRVNAMADNGQLDRIADQWAGTFLRIINGVDRLIFGYDKLSARGTKLHQPGLLETLPRRLDEIQQRLQPVVDLFGGWGNAIGVLAGLIIGGPLLAAIGSLTLAVTMFGIALAANPIGLVVIGIAALAAAAFGVYKAWEPLKGLFRSIWDGIKSAFEDGWNRVKPIVDKLLFVASLTPTGLLVRGAAAIGGYLTGNGSRENAKPGTPAPSTVFPKGAAAPANANVQGSLDIRIKSDGQPVVEKVSSANPDLDLNVVSGLAMMGAY